MGVARRHHLILVEKDQRICAAHLPQRFDDAIDQTRGPRGSDEMEDDLGVHCGLEDRALRLQAGAQLFCVDQVAVVGHGQGTVGVLRHQRLAVLQHRRASGGVAVVANGAQPPKPADNLLVEDISHQPHAAVEQEGLAVG